MTNGKDAQAIPLTPALLQKLRENEIRKQALLEGFLSAANVVGGQWEIATDGSALVRKD